VGGGWPSHIGMRDGGGDGPVMRPSHICMGEIEVEVGWWLVLCHSPVVSQPTHWVVVVVVSRYIRG
jgi:hypothetical protein